MNKILFIDASVRENSRTRELCEYLINKFDGKAEHIPLDDKKIPSLDRQILTFREECCKNNNFENEYFNYAKKFANADVIIICAPFWDNSFPAVLKKYLETVCVCNITFKYSKEGIPIGLCKAKKLYYVTSVGGKIYNDSFGYGYIKELANTMFGISETYLIKAEMLDVYGADVDKIMRTAKSDIDKYFVKQDTTT